MINHQVRLASRPAAGLPVPGDWQFTEEAVPEPKDGELRVEVVYASLDPAMRTWMNAGRSYVPPVEIGEVMRAAGVGRVVESRSAAFGAGDLVRGIFGIQEYAVVDAGAVTRLETDAALLPVHLGALGISGFTAYFGLIEIGKARAGDTVVVSAAAGSVGTVVGQIAKILGCRVVGIAGGAEKCAYLTDSLGFDAAIDYKADDLKTALKTACPDAIDVYFDNVGGATLNAVLRHLARGARIVLCGAVSQYNATSPASGPTNYMNLLVSRATMAGFVIFDYEDRFDEARAAIAGWIADGRLVPQTHVAKGLAQFPSALNELFAGRNIGKFILKIGQD